jgi:hypothetical protein
MEKTILIGLDKRGHNSIQENTNVELKANEYKFISKKELMVFGMLDMNI